MKYTRIDRKGRAADGWKKRVHEMNNNELKKTPKKHYYLDLIGSLFL
jgi:hypothetical protein